MAINKQLYDELSSSIQYIYTKKMIALDTYNIMIQHYKDMIEQLEKDKKTVEQIIIEQIVIKGDDNEKENKH